MATTDEFKPAVDCFPIQVLCNFINTYKGDRETLSAFLTNCQNALNLAAENQKQLLLKFIISKLEGKAQIACSNKIFDKFDDLKSFLKQTFGETKHYSHLLFDLQSCKQQANESVAQFALRVETCLTALQSEIHNSESLKKDLSGRIAMTEDLAMYTFSLGLNPNLSTVVRCKSPKNLNNAVNIAREEEKIQNLTSRTKPFKPKICRFCHKEGHAETECYSKIKRDKQITNPTQSNTQRQANNWPTTTKPQGTFNKPSPIVCRYCKNIGHDISQCRKRQYNNSRSREIKYLEYQSTTEPLADGDNDDSSDLN